MRSIYLAVLGTTVCALSCAGPKHEVPSQQPLPKQAAASSPDETSLEGASTSQGEEDLFGVDLDPSEDATVENTKSTDLQTILEDARQRSTNVLRAEGERTEAVGRRQQAAGEFAPTIRGGFRIRHLEGAEVGSLGPFAEGLSFTEYEPGTSVEWRFSPWEQLANFRASKREEKAATLQIADERRRAMSTAAKLYYRVLLTRASHRIASSLVEDAREFLALAKARTTGGVESGSDVARAKAELAQAEQKRQRTLKRWRVVSARLAAKLGWDRVGRPIAPDGQKSLETRTVVDAEKTERLASIASESRSDLQSAEERLEAAEHRKRAARWSLFGLHASASVGGRLIGVDLANLGPTFIGEGFVGAHIDFSQIGAVTEAKGREKVRESELLRVEREIRRELAAAEARLTSARRSLSEARNQLEAAKQNHDIQKARFEAGAALGLEVIRAQNRLAEARLDLAHRIASFNLAQVELLAATGRLTPDTFDE